MSIRVLTTRMVLPGKEASTMRMLKSLQEKASKAPGFVSSVAYRELESPSTMVVISEWYDLTSWHKWMDAMERNKLLDDMREQLYGPITHKVLVPFKDPDTEVFLV